MNNEQRISEIDNLLEQISPLNYEKICLETKLHFSKENYFKEFDEAKKTEIVKMEAELNNIHKKLTPLFTQLRKHQILYFVEYEGEFSNGNGQKYWQTQREFLYLKTNCDIDTTRTNGWSPYINDTNAKELLTEVQKFLLDNRFSNFKIRHIKKQ